MATGRVSGGRRSGGMAGGTRMSTGKRKAVVKASEEKTGRAQGSAVVNSKGRIEEYMSGAKVKGTARKIRDNAQRTELEAKGYSKRGSVLKYPSKKILGNPNKPTTPKVPVKKKGK
jgi:hypothetical protein